MNEGTCSIGSSLACWHSVLGGIVGLNTRKLSVITVVELDASYVDCSVYVRKNSAQLLYCVLMEIKTEHSN